MVSCGSPGNDDAAGSASDESRADDESAGDDSRDASVRRDTGTSARDRPVGDAATVDGSESDDDDPAPGRGGSTSDGGAPSRGGSSEAGANNVRDGQAMRDADGGSQPEPTASDAGTSQGDAATCRLPTTFQWSGGGPLAQPKNGWLSMKDVTYARHNGLHVLYFTTFQTGWGSGMMTFKDWPDAATAPQVKTSFGVAPTLFYFSPKDVWVLAYQWGAHKFSYRTSADPTNATGWSAERSLYRTALPPNGTGPIDQTVICDRTKCFLYYAGDNGHIYKSSMPIENFPGEFPAGTDSGIVGTTQNLFEGVQVYKVGGSDQYLMIVEAQGSARYFRAFTASKLDGPWTLLTNDFAVKKNVSLTPNWTNDISHADLVRSNPDETFTIDPCNLQMVFQGRDPAINTEYGKLPYRLGLITLKR
jgi:hypothetical protein